MEFVNGVTIMIMPNDAHVSRCPGRPRAVGRSSPWASGSHPSRIRAHASQERTLVLERMRKSPPDSSGGPFVRQWNRAQLTIVRRSHSVAFVPPTAAVTTRVLALRGMLLPRCDIRIELLLLIRCEDRSHRGELLLTRLLHLRPQRLHLCARGGRVTALTRGAGVFHRLLELCVWLLVLAQCLEARFLIGGQGNALEKLPARTPPTHSALALLVPLRLLSRLRRGSSDGAEG